jgi:UDP:flavonoid glycosyltransferase YjiC (YdhE family)
MKILLSPVGTRGDIMPVIALGRHLESEGHSISLCSTRDWKETAENLSWKFYPIDLDFRQLVEENTFFMGRPLLGSFRFIKNLKTIIRAHDDALNGIAEKFDLIIGSSLSISALNICEAHSVAYRHLFFCPNWIPSNDYPPPFISHQFSSSIANTLLWKLFLLIFTIFVNPFLKRYRKKYSLSAVKNLYTYYQRYTVLAHDAAIASISDSATGILHIPYPENNSTEELSDDILRFIEKGEAPVYIGFGSMPYTADSPLFQSLIAAVDALHLRAIVQTPKPLADEHSNNENILFIGSAPHEKLFSRMRLIIHHGGAGTTHTACKAGVPQIILPHVLDQFFWGNRIHVLGLGRFITGIRHLSRSRITEIISDVLRNNDYAKNAKKLSLAMKKNNIDTLHESCTLLLKGVTDAEK